MRLLLRNTRRLSREAKRERGRGGLVGGDDILSFWKERGLKGMIEVNRCVENNSKRTKNMQQCR
jgi:hypothetical protein